LTLPKSFVCVVKLCRNEDYSADDAYAASHRPQLRIASDHDRYFRYSHADDIITTFMEGYAIVGDAPPALRCRESGDRAVSRGGHRSWSGGTLPHSLFGTPAEALTLGHDRLAVMGVLIIGKHGEYPFNAKGQHLYPAAGCSRRLSGFFRRSGRSVPVYTQALSYSCAASRWMYEQSRALDFPLMAARACRWPGPASPGVSAWYRARRALAVGFSGIEVYGSNTLECCRRLSRSDAAERRACAPCVAWKVPQPGTREAGASGEWISCRQRCGMCQGSLRFRHPGAIANANVASTAREWAHARRPLRGPSRFRVRE